MAVVSLGEVASGSDSGVGVLVLNVTATIPRSDPTTARHLVVVLEAGRTDETIPFLTAVGDTAAEDDFYGECYGPNSYYEVGTEQLTDSGGFVVFTTAYLGIVVWPMDIGDAITLTYSAPWAFIRGAAFLYEGADANPNPFGGGNLRAYMRPENFGGAAGDNLTIQRTASTPTNCNQNDPGATILPSAAGWSFDPGMIVYWTTAWLDPQTSWAWDDGGITTQDQWFGYGGADYELSGVYGDQAFGSAIGPFVSADRPMGGCWGASDSLPNSHFLVQCFGLKAGAGPIVCPPPPEPGFTVECAQVADVAEWAVCITDPSDGSNTCDVFWRIVPALNANDGFNGVFTDLNIDITDAGYCIQDPDTGQDLIPLPGTGTWTVEAFFVGCNTIQGPTAQTILDAPCGSSHPPPPVPVAKLHHSLGCGIYTVYVLTRGGQFIVGQLPWSDLEWHRVLDDTSDAKVQIEGLAGRGYDCCQVLSQVRPWKHELGIYRDTELVWAGPITEPVIANSSDNATISARDLTSWLDRRKIHHDYTPGGATDLGVIFVHVVVDAMAPDNSPGLFVQATEAQVYGIYSVLAREHKIAGSEIRTLTSMGIDWTMIGRDLLAGGLVVPVAPAGILTDEHFAVPPDAKIDGLSQTNNPGVRGQGGGASGDETYGEVLDSASVQEFGLLESVAQDDLATTNQLAITAAEQIADLLSQPPGIIEQGQLHQNAPIDINRLVPGAEIDIRLSKSCFPVSQTFRISTVDAHATATDQGGTEEIVVNVIPLGTKLTKHHRPPRPIVGAG